VDNDDVTWLAVVLIMAVIWLRYRPYLDAVVFGTVPPTTSNSTTTTSTTAAVQPDGSQVPTWSTSYDHFVN
jgi:hypothetical protein